MTEPSAACPVCGKGTLIDIAFDEPATDGPALTQQADSHQMLTFDCGHEVPGPDLNSADAQRLSVERRRSQETTEPA
jgi:hypothetical protein